MRYRFFLIAFFCTLVVFGAGCGFALVNGAAEKGGFGGASQLLQVERTGQSAFLLWIGGRQFALDLRPLNDAAQAAQRNGLFAPRGVRLLALWAEAARQWYDGSVERTREREFYENAGLI